MKPSIIMALLILGIVLYLGNKPKDTAVVNNTGFRLDDILDRLAIRRDSSGSGDFGASRGNRSHEGIDLEANPGDMIYSPITGKIERLAKPYGNDPRYNGIVLKGEGHRVKIFYAKLADDLKVGDYVSRGNLIGYAEDIAAKYGVGMVNHIHVELRDFADNLYDPTNYVNLV